MQWLNYHHLLYFWTVAREGSIARACEKLYVAQPTISGQLRQLERTIGDKLYTHVGKELRLTETGKLVFEYAEDIFNTGQELMDALRGGRVGRPLQLAVGVPDFMPKLVVYRLLEPVFGLPERVQIVCREGKLEDLLADLALYRLDVVLADSQIGSHVKIRAFNHFLGECHVSFVAPPRFSRRFKNGFPRSLDGAPLLLPTENTLLRSLLDQWFHEQRIEPDVIGEFEDSALLKTFAAAGVGIAPVPAASVKDVDRQYGLKWIGNAGEMKARFYAISVERKVKHPAVIAIAENAQIVLADDGGDGT